MTLAVGLPADSFNKFRFVDDLDSELFGFFEFAAGFVAGEDEGGGLGDGVSGFAAEGFDFGFDFAAAEMGEGAGDDDGFAGEGLRAGADDFGLVEYDAQIAELAKGLLTTIGMEKAEEGLGGDSLALEFSDDFGRALFTSPLALDSSSHFLVAEVVFSRPKSCSRES